ncbi:hypothetical protein VNO77_38982 [Canavalia gladiata]|uniref:Uncharacterized protein n=1 Tax=Canavalia gladiata TaxID=3824 RepID=A0AAN9KCA4_CANGL
MAKVRPVNTVDSSGKPKGAIDQRMELGIPMPKLHPSWHLIIVEKSLIVIGAHLILPLFKLRCGSDFSNQDRKTSGASWIGSQILLFYLRLRAREIVRKCYLTRVERADDWLTNEMLRASHDPSVLVILESIFSFNFSILLNYALEEAKEKVLIIKGMKDPIFDSASMVAMLKEHCNAVMVK